VARLLEEYAQIAGAAITLKHHADPVSEVDRRTAVRLAQLTSGSVGKRG
jgi:hypothetical protein